MNLIRRYYTPPIFRPSFSSSVGMLIGGNEVIGVPHPAMTRIQAVGHRALCALVILLAPVLDLIIWSGITLSVYLVFRVGFRNHLTNLISIIASPILCIPILFGYYPQFSYTRSAHCAISTNLVAAIIRRDSKSVRYLISNDETVPLGERKDYLHLAASIPGNQAIISVFMRSSWYQPNNVSYPTNFPLYHSVRSGCRANMDAGISGGADVNQLIPLDPKDLDLASQPPSTWRLTTSPLAVIFFSRNVFRETPFLFPTALSNYDGKYPDVLVGRAVTSMQINQEAVRTVVNAVGHLIRNHAFYSSAELYEAKEFCDKYESYPTDPEKHLHLWHWLYESDNVQESRNPYITFIAYNLLEKYGRPKYWEVKETLNIFLRYCPTFEHYQLRAEEAREAMLRLYIPATVPNVMVRTIASYWIPGPRNVA